MIRLQICMIEHEQSSSVNIPERFVSQPHNTPLCNGLLLCTRLAIEKQTFPRALSTGACIPAFHTQKIRMELCEGLCHDPSVDLCKLITITIALTSTSSRAGCGRCKTHVKAGWRVETSHVPGWTRSSSRQVAEWAMFQKK